MLDINLIRKNPALIKKNNQRRKCNINVDEILELDKKKRATAQKLDQLKAQRNKVSYGKKPTAGQIKKMQQVGKKIKNLESKLQATSYKLQTLLDQLPNLISDEVPDGQSDEDNVEVEKFGDLPKFDFKPKSHEQLGENLDLIDIKRAVKTTGTRFYYLKNQAVLLRLALTQFALDHLMKQGFVPFITPHLVKERTLYSTGYLPFFPDDIYDVMARGRDDKEKLTLIGTSEQTLVGYHMDEMLRQEDLPLLYTGISSCFRTEAGSAGKDIKGILRVHEFFKVEQIVFCKPKDSEKYHKLCQKNEEELCQKLGLPYRKMLICTGDCGAPGYKKFDLEIWFPSQGKYREATSNTNLLDFQTRRLNTRYKNKAGEKIYPHTISATAITDRHLIAILENYQQADGSIKIPEVLQRFMGGTTKISNF